MKTDEVIPVEWIDGYLNKERDVLDQVRKVDDDGTFSRELLKKIETIEEMLEAYRR